MATIEAQLRAKRDAGRKLLVPYVTGGHPADWVDVVRAVERLKMDPSVLYAEPNYIVKLNVVPNDPRFNELWGLLNTGQSGGTADADIDASKMS